MKPENILIQLALFMLLIPVFSCNKVNLREFQSAREKWDALEDDDYSYVLDIGCFCPQASFTPARVVVQNDSVVAIQNISTGFDLIDESDSSLVFDKYGAYFPTIDGLFDVLEDALPNADKVEVQYNEQFGYPREISIDWIKEALDDELVYSASSLLL